MIKAILFDIDGTLLDTKEFIYSAYEHTLKKHDINISRENLESLGGKTLEEYYKILAPDIEFELLKEVHREFQSKNMHLAVPFPGVVKTLKNLKSKGIKTAAITSRGKWLLMENLKTAKIDQYFDLIITIEDVKNPKPDPEGILKALNYFIVSPEEAIYIGDSLVDIEAGKNAKVKTAGVAYGFLGPDISKLKPDFLVNNLSQLKEILSI